MTGGQPPDRVLDIWSSIVGTRLSAQSGQLFLDRPEVRDLRWYSDEVLNAAGTELFSRRGELLLADWVAECGRAGLGVARLDWDQVVGAHEVAMRVRGLVRTAVAGLSSPRRQALLFQRLGLDDRRSPTLQAVGQELGVSGARVQQIQEKALGELRRGHHPPRPNDQARHILTALLRGADAAGTSRAACLLTLAEMALPVADPRMAVITLATLAGARRESVLAVAADAATLLTAQRAADSTATGATAGPIPEATPDSDQGD